MPDVTVRDLKDWPLDGGTLIVSIPQFGLGSVLLTDHILEAHRMDHVAALDSDDLPPVALVRKGKARHPFRIHADAATRLAVLRSEFPPPVRLARPVARAVLDWAKRRGLARVVVLDHLHAGENAPPRRELQAIASDDAGRERARKAGLAELDNAVLGGLLGVLALEARFEKVDVTGLVAQVRKPEDEADSLLAFADALPHFAPGVRLDLARLRAQSQEVAEALKGVQSEIERTVRQMQPKPGAEGPPIYG